MNFINKNLAMAPPLPPILSNIFKEYFEVMEMVKTFGGDILRKFLLYGAVVEMKLIFFRNIL